jgi:hypothetical protein
MKGQSKMLGFNIFAAVAELAVSAKSRRDAEHREFLRFYRALVEELPTEAIAIFGTMSVKASVAGKQEDWGIELNAADFMWWKTQIETNGARLIPGPASVQAAMLNHLAKKASTQNLDPEQRKRLLTIMDDAETA